jgi:predicted GIY-YIG superfamily endonuclease
MVQNAIKGGGHDPFTNLTGKPTLPSRLLPFSVRSMPHILGNPHENLLRVYRVKFWADGFLRWGHRKYKNTRLATQVRYRQSISAGFSFTWKYSPTSDEPIEREKSLKNWRREWKINLVRQENPDLLDLAADWFD